MDNIQQYSQLLSQVDSETNALKQRGLAQELKDETVRDQLLEASFPLLAENKIIHNGIKYAFNRGKGLYDKVGEVRGELERVRAKLTPQRSPLPQTEPVKRPTQITQEQNSQADDENPFGLNEDTVVRVRPTEIQQADSLDTKLVTASDDAIKKAGGVVEGLEDATDISEAGDETGVGDVLTLGLGLATALASGIEGLVHKKPKLPTIANPSVQFGA